MKKQLRILLVCLIITGVLYAPVFRAEQAQAQLGTFAGIIANCLIRSVVGALIQVAIGIVLSLITNVPVIKAESLGDFIKEYILDPTMRCVVRGVVDEVIGSMLDVVRNKGRDGAAAYVRNWRNFQVAANYRGEEVLRGLVSNTQLCGFLRDGLYDQLGINTSYQFSLQGVNVRINALHPFTLRAKCPLPDTFDLRAYGEDPVNNGGWAAFNRMLSPAGQSAGLSILTQDELESNRQLEEAADTNEVAEGGFTGTRGSSTAGSGGPVTVGLACTNDGDCGAGAVCGEYRCASVGVIGSGTGAACSPAFGCPGGGICQGTCSAQSGSITNAANEPACLQFGPNGKCIRYSDVRSPASYIKETVAAQIQQELAWLTAVDELNELVVGWIWTRLSNRLQDLGAQEELPQYTVEDTSGTNVPGGAGGGGGGPTPTPGGGGGGQGGTTCDSGATESNTGGTFNGAVNSAIDFVCRTMCSGTSITSTAQAYMQAVVDRLNASGYSARIHVYGDGKNITVKRPGGPYSEDFAIWAGDINAPRIRRAYAFTCTPASAY